LWHEVEGISNEEFPFENFNNMTSGNGLLLLKRDQARKRTQEEFDSLCSWEIGIKL